MIRWNIWWIFGRPKSETIRGYLNKVSNPHASPATPDRSPKQGHNQEGQSIRAPGSIKPSKQPRKYSAPIGPIHGSNPNLKCSCRSILEKTQIFSVLLLYAIHETPTHRSAPTPRNLSRPQTFLTPSWKKKSATPLRFRDSKSVTTRFTTSSFWWHLA